MQHAFSLLAIPHTFYSTEECKKWFCCSCFLFVWGTVFPFKGRIMTVVSVYHPVPWSQETCCKIQFHPSNKNYYCCKGTNISIKTFSFQKSFQLRASKYKFQQGNIAAFNLSHTRSNVQSWRQLWTAFHTVKWNISYMWKPRSCPVFHNSGAAQESIINMITNERTIAHSQVPFVVKRSDSENIGVCIWFYSYK